MKQKLLGHKIKINNLNLYYYTYGLGPPLLFIHGHRSDSRRWENIIFYLGSHFQVYSCDLPGFGKSPRLKGWHSMGRYAEILTLFVEKMGLKDFVLVGGSMGGIIAIKMLANQGLGCRKLALLGTPYDRSCFKMGSFKIRVIKTALKMAVRSRVISRIADKIFSYDFFLYRFLKRSFPLPDRTDKIIRFEMRQWRVMKIRTWMETNYDILSVNFAKENLKIKIPTLLICAKEDRYLKVEPTIAGFKKIFSDCQTIFLHFKGHVPKGEFSFEQIKALNPLFRPFLAGKKNR